jgi:DeoR/GlpR family transcriptional regulator of sugar metabolism
MNYLDKHSGATVTEVVRATKVSKPTVRRYYTLWVERNQRQGAGAAPFTEELPAVHPATSAVTSDAVEA